MASRLSQLCRRIGRKNSRNLGKLKKGHHTKKAKKAIRKKAKKVIKVFKRGLKMSKRRLRNDCKGERRNERCIQRFARKSKVNLKVKTLVASLEHKMEMEELLESEVKKHADSLTDERILPIMSFEDMSAAVYLKKKCKWKGRVFFDLNGSQLLQATAVAYRKKIKIADAFEDGDGGN